MSVAQDAPELVTERAEGVVEITSETRFEVVGVRGTIVVRAGAPGELRFMCRSEANRQESRTLGLWAAGATVGLRPADTTGDGPVRLEVTLPPRMATRIETTDSRVSVASLEGAITVHGARLAFEGRGNRGDVEVSIDDGSADIQSSGADVALEGSKLKAKLREVAGAVSVAVSDSAVELFDLRAELQLDVQRTTVTANRLGRTAEVKASGGSLVLEQLQQGGHFQLSETPITITQSRHAVEIDTDAAVRVLTLDGGLLVRGDGGDIEAQTVSGVVDIDTREVAVALQAIGGPSKVRGDRLALRVQNAQGDLAVSTTSSEVEIRGAVGALTVENSWGDVVVGDAQKSVHVVSSEGSVRVTELAGPAQVLANGPEVVVHWLKTMPGDAASHVENRGGDVRLQFSPDAGGQLDAEAPDGQIACTIREVVVGADGGVASGIVHRRPQPAIRAIAAGNLSIESASATAPRRRPAQ